MRATEVTVKNKWMLFPVLFTLLSTLTGCAGMNSTFDCPMKPAVVCKSLDQVNTLVDQGRLGVNNSDENLCPTCSKTHAKIAFKNTGDFTTLYPNFTMQPGDPVRYGETVMRIWMAPFEDKNGNYYQPITVYTVVKKGHWIGSPVKAVTDDGDDA